MRYGGNTACVEVRIADDHVIVLDGGTGIRALGATLDREPPNDVYVLLSHQHSDHVIGLPFFSPMLHSGREVVMSCAATTPDALRRFVQPMFAPPYFPPIEGALSRVRYVAWSIDTGLSIGGNARALHLDARHPGGASIIAIEDRAGLLLAYAPDNELSYEAHDGAVDAGRTALAQRLHGVPLLLHDATYTDEELPGHVGWGHSSVSEATRFAVECDAGRLLLFHHHPDRTDDAVDAMVAQGAALARSLGSALIVEAATEGRVLTIPETTTPGRFDGEHIADVQTDTALRR